MSNPQWLKLPLSRINFHGPKDVQAIESLLCVSFVLQQSNSPKVWRSLDSEPNNPQAVVPARPPFCKIRSSSMPAPGTKKMEGSKSMAQSRSGRGSVSNENNVLLDPEVLTDYPTQVLVLTVLVST